MADVLAILGAVLALVIVFPGIIIAWRQLFPATVECARLRLDRTPWRCFWLGCITTFILLPPVVTLLALPLELTRLVGCSLFFIVLAFAGLGAAGLAAMIGGRLVPHASNSISPTTTSVPGTIAFELAAGFWLGGVATVILLPPIVILLDLPFTLAWPVGCSLFSIVVALTFLGRAGLAAKRGVQLAPHASNSISPTAAFVRGTVALELAVGFPIIGWFIVIPLTFIASLGSAVFALLRWAPRVAAPAARKKTRTRRVVASSLVVFWVLLFVAISVSVVAFLVRGGVPLELAADFPAIGWVIIISLYIIMALAAIIFALLRWVPRATAAVYKKTRMKIIIVLSIILVWVLPFAAVSLSAVAFDDSGPTKTIPNGLLYPLVPECEKFIRYHPTDYSKPVAHVPIPQHHYMAPNPGNNMHCDAYISDTYEASGPLGLNPQVVSRTQGFGGYGTITFDSRGWLVGVYGDARAFQLELMDPYTLEELASYDLPPRPWDFFFQGVLPWEYLGAGIYFYLDNQDRAIVPTTKNTIQVVQVPDPEGGAEFELVREYDLADYIVPEQEDSVAWVLPEWSGECYWYATTAGIVGTVNVDSGEVHTLRLEGELIENSFAVGEDGVFIISDRAMYRFSQDSSGDIIIDWRTEYDRGPQRKPGHITRGSGTSVTLMGTPQDGLVVITDNAEPRVNLLFIRRFDGALVCSTPLFEEGKSGTDLTTIAFEHADENGDSIGVYSTIVENNWGHHTFPLSRPEPGLTRVDITRHDDGTYTCEEIWASSEKSIGGFRLSLGNGLVYMYGKGESGLITEEKWYFTAVDFITGETVYKKLAGTGLGYNNWQGSFFIHPDGMAYSTTIFGAVMLRDKAP
jgi:hypothetical protein